MNILIIGGNGFIGSHLVETLKDDHAITVFGRSPNKFGDEFKNVEYIYGDFNDTALLSKAVQGQEIVYHLLSTTVPVTGNMDPAFDVQSNLVGTINLLEIISKSDVKRLIYTSSGGTVYGNPEYIPIDENHPCNPIGSYGIVKNTIEKYIGMYAQQENFSYLIVRPSNPYGPGQNFKGQQGLIAKLLYQGFVQKEFVIWGDGTAVRDYVYIDDLTNFLKNAGLSDISGIYNLGSGKGQSINEIVELMKGIVEKLPPIKYTAKNSSFVERVVLDITSSKKTFGWDPRVSMKEGISRQLEWMKSLKI